ncbi:MAG: HEAT repeat domain-containing protein [Bdellovibrionales bacterium]|nr:HEAT repeat domain-containing protein [Bdellovibrionales bacterium]
MKSIHPTSRHLKPILAGALGVILCLFLYLFVFRASKLDPRYRSKPELYSDLQALRKTGADEPHPSVILIALHRLNKQQLPEGRSEALSRVQHPNPLVRTAVAQSLGLLKLEGPVLQALELLALDPEASVRNAVFKGLNESLDEVKKNWVFAFYEKNKSTLHPDQKLEISNVLFRFERSPEWLGKALELAKKSQNGDPSLFAQALSVLIQMNPIPVRNPTEKEASDFLKQVFFSGHARAENRPALFRYLANHHASSLRTWYEESYFKADPVLQISAIQVISRVCPKNLKEIINQAESSPVEKRSHRQLARIIKEQMIAAGKNKGTDCPWKD